MPYIAHVSGKPWTNPVNGAIYSSEQEYRHAMMCESYQDMLNWRDFQRSHGLKVTPFGEQPGCVLTGLTGQARINECAGLGAIQFPIVRPSRSTKIYKREPTMFKKDKRDKEDEEDNIAFNALQAAEKAAKLLADAV